MDSSDSTSDDEYIPPESDHDFTEVKPPDEQITNNKTIVLENAKKLTEDELWGDFVESTGEPITRTKDSQYLSHVKKYSFAGEEIEVTEKVLAKDGPINNKTDISKEMNNRFSKDKLLKLNKSNPNKMKCSNFGISSALQNLQSTASSKLPKLSTLEKSRLDWREFVTKESIGDELRAHDIGKEGYLERQAFINRTTHREYQFNEKRKSNSSRRT